jgi:HK97 family phage portal protein
MSQAQYKALHGLKWDQVIPHMISKGTAEIVEDHPVLALLANPMGDGSLTQNDLIQATVTYLDLEGEAYWERIWANKNRTEVAALWPMVDPRYVWAIPGETELIRGWVYRKSAKAIVFDKRDLIAFRYFNPETPYYGLSPTEVLRQAILADVKAIDWNRLFFENDATPGMVLVTDQALTTSQAQEVEARWEAKHRGVGNAHRTHVFGSGLRPERYTPTHRDMQFLNLRAWSREEILAAYGVPPLIVGLYQETNRATAQTMRRLFWENAVIPRLGKIEQTLNAELVPDEDIQLFFDLSEIEALQEDVAEMAQIGVSLLAQGWTPNEIRDWWGKPQGEGEDLDRVFVPAGFIPVGEVRTKSADKEETKGAQDRPLAGDPYAFVAPADPGGVILETVARAHLPKLVEQGATHGAEILTKLGVDIGSDWMQRYSFQPTIEEYTKWRGAQLRRWLTDETQAEVLDVIREGMRDGQGPQAIADRLREQFDWMSRVRAERIARTETLTAVATGQHKLYEETGIEQRKWLHALHGDSREGHKMLHGTVKPLDEPFVNPITGVSLAYPGDPAAGPAEVVNCRCAESPVPVTLHMEDDIEYQDPYQPARIQTDDMSVWDRSSAMEATKRPVEYDKDSPNYGDHVLKEISKAQGFDGKPRVVSKEQMDALVKEKGVVEMYRGLSGERADAYAKQFIYGDFFCGRGAHGSGTYAAGVGVAAKGDPKSAWTLASTYAERDGTVLRMALRPGARVIDERSLAAKMHAALDELGERAASMPRDEYLRARSLIEDPGRFAAASGYDAIVVGSMGPESMDTVTTWVVLNRTALTVQKEVLKP